MIVFSLLVVLGRGNFSPFFPFPLSPGSELESSSLLFFLPRRHYGVVLPPPLLFLFVAFTKDGIFFRLGETHETPTPFFPLFFFLRGRRCTNALVSVNPFFSFPLSLLTLSLRTGTGARHLFPFSPFPLPSLLSAMSRDDWWSCLPLGRNAVLSFYKDSFFLLFCR